MTDEQLIDNLRKVVEYHDLASTQVRTAALALAHANFADSVRLAIRRLRALLESTVEPTGRPQHVPMTAPLDHICQQELRHRYTFEDAVAAALALIERGRNASYFECPDCGDFHVRVQR